MRTILYRANWLPSKWDEILFQPQYLALEELCQDFAVELLAMCRNQSEVTTILNSFGLEDVSSQEELNKHSFEEGIPNLGRLRLAVNYNQKQASFFSHLDPFLIARSVNTLSTSACIGFIYCISFIGTVRSPSNLPAGSFIHLVWKLVWLERQQDCLETPGVSGDLFHHAFPLPHLLDCPKVKGLSLWFGQSQDCGYLLYYWTPLIYFMNLIKLFRSS